MKIHINYNSKSGPWGGGNQFLKALRDGLVKSGNYSEDIKGADALLFNSYHDLSALTKAYFLHRKKKIIYRLGPIFHTYRSGFKWKMVDRLVILSANLFANLVIFQSKWSHEKAVELGFSKTKKYVIIYNAVDASIFSKKDFKEKTDGEPTKLIYTSWSTNMRKGFKYLRFLDEKLDFSKYSMAFIGNSPFVFKNIKMVEPLPSTELAQKLRESDIFISPVEDDACSNALLEGLASGLPTVALISGGNPELVGAGGELFKSEAELLAKIEKVAKSLKFYYDQISVKSMELIAKEYVEAIENNAKSN